MNTFGVLLLTDMSRKKKFSKEKWRSLLDLPTIKADSQSQYSYFMILPLYVIERAI